MSGRAGPLPTRPFGAGRPRRGGTQRKLWRALRSAMGGELRFDTQSRALYATDASNFRHVPIGVVVPRDPSDVVAAVRVCSEHDVPIVSRGGGTGLAGQSLNAAVVIDHSKYLRGVLGIDPQARTARVLPGTVLDDLRARAGECGLTFGPDPSTHDRCTLGGMIGNNSCGVHSVQAEFYGPGPRTEDNVESLDVLTYDGVRLRVGPTSDEACAEIQRQGGRAAAIYRELRGIVERHGDAIRSGFPSIPRRVSGYNLPALLPESGFDVAKALVGSEGTCVTVLEATVKLCRRFPERALLLLGYPTVFAAGDDVPRIREHRPIGTEGIDSALVDYIRRKGMHPGYADILPEGQGWLLVEFGGATKEEAASRAHEAQQSLAGTVGAPHSVVLADEEQQHHLWAVRESALGATAFVPGQGDTWPGWEDAAVPVDRLGAYLRDLEDLYERYDYEGALYGHFGQGCVHSRIDFDLTTNAGVDKYVRFTREAAELCMRHGGSLSGEHGDGQQRSDLLELMYGAEILDAFREFKAAWDPRGRMNPGRIVDPAPRDTDLRLDHWAARWKPATRFAFPEDGDDFGHAALRCVGVGKCRADDGIMCPSYMVTRDEEHTTRGRARLLFEMVRGETVTDRWRSGEVKEALDLCLSCKGCRHDCPVDVDIARYKAEFLSHYYERRRRPRHAYALGLVHRWLRIGTSHPRMANALLAIPGFSGLAKRAAGIAVPRHLPRFAARPFRRSFREPAGPSGRSRVLLWVDCFNNAFFPGVLAATAEALEHAGFEVVLPPVRLCCGRALYDYGMLDAAMALWRETLDALAPEIAAGTPVVGAEPSCVAAFRDELPGLFPGDDRAASLSRTTWTLAGFLRDHRPDWKVPRLDHAITFHGHCHQKATVGADADLALLRRAAPSVEEPEPGCCGLAGSFGFESGKFAVSRAIGEQRLLPAVRAAPGDTLIVADGFSCREQIAQFTGRRPLHLAEVLRLARSGEASGAREEET